MLSDQTIRRMMSSGWLVPAGDAQKAAQAAYHFTAGKIFVGGQTSPELDWSSPAPGATYAIAPGAMVWVRMKDEVRLPNNICAVWWQTHSLSKKGIMLLNMSVVDPGYSGLLTCLLVNFGAQHVVITPDTPIAKLAFFRVDHDVSAPFLGGSSVTAYDADILQTAANGPKSFMQLENLKTELGARKQEILAEIAADAPKKLAKTYAYAALGLIILIIATTAVPWIQSKFKPNLEDIIQAEIDKRVAAQLSLTASEREKALTQRVEALEKKSKLQIDKGGSSKAENGVAK